MKTPTVDLRIVNSSDCQSCRRCCTFAPHNWSEAPLFTDEQRSRALLDFSDQQLEFVRQGTVWQVVLRTMPHSEKRVCPFFDFEGAKCKIYHYGIFDCHTWPFYIMRKDDMLVIALSLECPAANSQNANFIERFARTVIGPQMLEFAKMHPEFVLTYNNSVRIIYHIANVSEIFGLSNPEHRPE